LSLLGNIGNNSAVAYIHGTDQLRWMETFSCFISHIYVVWERMKTDTLEVTMTVR